MGSSKQLLTWQRTWGPPCDRSRECQPQISRETSPELARKADLAWTEGAARMGVIAAMNDKFAASVVSLMITQCGGGGVCC